MVIQLFIYRLLAPVLLLLLVSCGSLTAPGTGAQSSETMPATQATQQVQPTTAMMTPDSIPTLSPATVAPIPPTKVAEPAVAPTNAASEITPTSSVALPRDALELQALAVAVYQPGDPAVCGLPLVLALSDLDLTVRVFFACSPDDAPEVSAVPAREVAVPPGADPKRIAMHALLAGPTTAEQEAGIIPSLRPTIPRFRLKLPPSMMGWRLSTLIQPFLR